MEMQSKKAKKRWTNHVSGDVENVSEQKKNTRMELMLLGNSPEMIGIDSGIWRWLKYHHFTQIHRYDVGNIYGGGFTAGNPEQPDFIEWMFGETHPTENNHFKSWMFRVPGFVWSDIVITNLVIVGWLL